jgi:hypothetical protein
MIWTAGAMLLGAFWTGVIGAQAPAQGGGGSLAGVKTIDNPGGGRIFLGVLAGQPTPQQAMGKTLHRLSVYCGDRPKLGRLVQSKTGELLAAFFTVTGKNQDGKPMAGLALVYAPKSGSAGGAVLMDNAERFPSTVNSMFARLKQQLGKGPAGASLASASSGGSAASKSGASGSVASGSATSGSTASRSPASGSATSGSTASGSTASGSTASGSTASASTASGSTASGSTASGSTASGSSASVPAAPPEPLQRDVFQDGTGVIGLPAGWNAQPAHMGDVSAAGPHGEKLRFGMTIPVMGNSGAKATGQFVAIPSGTDPAAAYKSAMAQLGAKAGKQAPDITVTNVRDLPMQGGKNSFLYGDVDAHDGQGKQFFVVQMITTTPQQGGAWQMTLFQVWGPEQVMAEERTTIGAIYASYSRDSKRVSDIANAQIAQGIAQTNQFVASVGQYIDDSDRMTAGMSDILREQTVVVDENTGGHARTSDQLAGMLIDANPNRFQAVPTSGYISGIDY